MRMQPSKAIPMSLSTAMPWGEMVATAIGTGGLTQLLNWWTNRNKAQAYSQGMIDRAMEKALRGVSDQLTRTDERLRSVETHRDECEQELETGRQERAELQRQIASLMSGRVAALGEPAPGAVQ